MVARSRAESHTGGLEEQEQGWDEMIYRYGDIS